MSTTHDVTLGGVNLRCAYADPNAELKIELAVYTKTGQARIATLDEVDLLRLITESAGVLEILRQRRAKGWDRPTDMKRNADDYTDCNDGCYGQPCVHRWPSTYRGTRTAPRPPDERRGIER